MPDDYSGIYQQAGNTFNVDPLLAQAVAQVESGGDPGAVSRDAQGNPVAYGTMQLTAPNLQRLNVPDPYNPQYNIPAGTRMLDEALTTANGDVPTALRIYQGGTDQSKWGPQNAAYPAKVAAAYQKLASAQQPPASPSGYSPSMPSQQSTATRTPDAIDAFLTGAAPQPPVAAGAAGAVPARTPDAVDDFLTGKGAPPPAATAPAPAPIWNEYGITGDPNQFGPSQPAPAGNTSLGNVAQAAIEGIKEGFGSEPLGLSPQSQQSLVSAGVYNGPGDYNPLKAVNQAVINPLAAGADLAMRGANALFRGAQGAVAQTGAEAGAPVLGRDIAALPEAFMGDAGGLVPHGEELAAPLPTTAPEITQFPVTARSVMDNAPITVRPPVANDAARNIPARTPTAIQTPSFVPPGAQVPAPVIEATRPDFIPPAPSNPLAPVATPPQPPRVVVRNGQAVTPASQAYSTVPNPLQMAANDVNPLLPRPANDAEAYPAWNAGEPPAVLTSRPATPPNALSAPPVAPAIETPTMKVPANSSAAPIAPIDPATTQTARAVAAARATDEMSRVMAPAQQGLDTTNYVPGVRPTEAEISADPELAVEQKRLRIGNEAPFVEAENANNDARSDYFSQLAGTPEDVARLQDARSAQAQNDLASAFANKGVANAQPVVDTINSILASPDGVRPLVQTKLNQVLGTLYDQSGKLQTDPEMLYGARKAIDDTLSKEATRSEPLNARVASNLQAVKGALDQAIEPAAPGFDKYLANFAAASKPIDTLETLQSYQPKLTNGPNRMMTFGKVDSMMRNIVADRAAPGVNPAKSIDPDTMSALFNLHADLRRSANADQLAKAKGSDTAQLLEYGKKLGVTAAHGVAAHTMPVIGNALVHFTQDAAGKALLKKRIDRALNPDVAKLVKKYGSKRNPLQAPPADTE